VVWDVNSRTIPCTAEGQRIFYRDVVVELGSSLGKSPVAKPRTGKCWNSLQKDLIYNY
jgi:hypothetical protein